MPEIAIGVPVRNGERYLGEALEAIRAQTFADFECLVSDNGSDDRSGEIARAICRRDPRFRYVRHERNAGAASNFNFTVRNTTAPLFRWACHDDLMRPTCLEACRDALEAAPHETVLAFTGTVLVDGEGRELGPYRAATRRGGATPSSRLDALIGPGDFTRSLAHMCFPVCGLVRRSALARTSLIANMPRSDTLLLVELALLGPWAEVEEDLFLRRHHDGGSVIAAEKAASGPERERLLAAWYDPSRGARFPATITRLGIGFLRAVARTPMPPAEKVRCAAIASNWMARNGRRIGGEMKIVLSERLGRPHGGRPAANRST